MLQIIKKKRNEGGNVMIFDKDLGVPVISFNPRCTVGLHPKHNREELYQTNSNDPSICILITNGTEFKEEEGYAISLGTIGVLEDQDTGQGSMGVDGGQSASIDKVLDNLIKFFFYDPAFAQYM